MLYQSVWSTGIHAFPLSARSESLCLSSLLFAGPAYSHRIQARHVCDDMDVRAERSWRFEHAIKNRKRLGPCSLTALGERMLSKSDQANSI